MLDTAKLLAAEQVKTLRLYHLLWGSLLLNIIMALWIWNAAS
jgi:hypothetical protein